MSKKNREQELKEILKRYVNNEATLSEMEAVDRWYDSLNFEVSAEQLFVQPRIEPGPKPKLNPAPLFWSAAAAVVLITFAAFWFIHSSSMTTAADTLISSGKKERKQLKLADGTEVMLNTGSELIVSGDFGEGQRRVELRGEAYFKVARNPEKPFIIQSGQLSTQVLGTAFNVSAYPDRERIKVSVSSGRVKVSQQSGSSEQVLAKAMIANQTISFFRKTGRFELNTEDAELISSWRENKLYIDNASMQDITELLKGFYQIEVKDLSGLDHHDRYTIRFNRESMKAVLAILTQLTKREFHYHNNQITIK